MLSYKRSLTSQILLAIAMGVTSGLIFGNKALFLGSVGTFLIQCIKTVAVPLIFFAIIEALLTQDINWRSAKYLVIVIVINTFSASLIGISLSNIFLPGKYLSSINIEITSGAKEKFNTIQGKGIFSSLDHIFPTNMIDPFQKNSVIAIVIIALLVGVSARIVRSESVEARQNIQVFASFISACFKIFEQILKFIIKLIPLAIFCVIARTVGEYGFAPIKGLFIYIVIGLIGLSLQVLVTYQLWISCFAKIKLSTFWSGVREAVTYALGSNSSLATLPITLRTLDGFGVRKSSSRLGACVATNLNNDGILLYEAMAALLVAQASGIELSLSQQLIVAGLSIIAAIGITGVPEAGLISLALVLTSVGLPLDILPVLLTVDWIIARGRSVVNVLSDIVVSIVVDRFETNNV